MNTGIFVFVLLCPTIFIRAESHKRLLLHDDQSIAEAIHELQANVAKLNSSFQTTLTTLQTSMQSEINRLNAELQAEKNERCQIGTANFHKCQQCAEDVAIQFNPPFTKVPSVFQSLDALDVDGGRNIRIGASVKSVTTHGATLTVNTWADTIIYGSTLSWIACPT